ncbi:CocE/NonD family hydrolase [Gemmatimonas sp.]
MVLGLLMPSAMVSAAPTEPESTYVRTHYIKQVVRIPMRDGTRLFTIVYRPRDAGLTHRYPLLPTRTPFSIAPYDTAVMAATIAPDPIMQRDGYIFVQQEVRGRYQSEGDFENVRPLAGPLAAVKTSRHVDEATDAWDTIEWLQRHTTGHNGRVGVFGVSYGGYYAGIAAATRHPAIQAMSLQAPVADFFFEDFRHNGAVLLGNVFAFPVFGTPRPQPTATHWWLPALQRASAADTGADYATLLALGPLRTISDQWYPQDQWWRAHRLHPHYDAFWRARSLLPHLRFVRVPSLVVGGWFDAENLWGALHAHRALQAVGSAPVTLVMGPFAHRAWSTRDSGAMTHGAFVYNDAPAQRFQSEVQAPFFRATLKHAADRSTRQGVHVYDTGRGGWTHLAAWPARGSRQQWWLRADGGLDTVATRGPSATGGHADRLAFTSNPLRPVPSACTAPTIEDGGVRNYLTDDQRCLQGRTDVLSFVGAPLAASVTVAGPLQAEVVIETTASDLDVVVKLVDVFPERPVEATGVAVSTVTSTGARQQLVRGEIMRARHRTGFGRAIPMRPNTAERITIELPDVYHTFRAGHRIMVQIHSSWFPLFDRNPQQFVPNIFEALPSDFVAARHTVHVGSPRGSRIVATVLP